MSDERVVRGEDGVARCFWGSSPPEYQAYHDTEWGFPVDDDRRLFEKLVLEGFQSGLSWLTILRKRDNFRKAFATFDFERVARFGEKDVERLLQDAASSATAARSRRPSTTPSEPSSSSTRRALSPPMSGDSSPRTPAGRSG